MNEYSQYGVLGATILMLLGGLKILWDKSNKKDEEHAKERREDRDRHLEEFKRLFEDNQDVTKNYSKDSKDITSVIKEFEMLLKQKNQR